MTKDALETPVEETQAAEDVLDGEAFTPRQVPLPPPHVLMGGVFVVAALVAGILPAMTGYGPFGWRLMTTERAEVHVINRTGETLVVYADLAEPLVIQSGHLDTLRTRTGRNTLRAVTEAGEEIERHEGTVAPRMFFNPGGATCLAVLDLTGYYGGREGEMEVVDRLDADRRLVPLTSTMVLLPRRPPPQQVVGTLHWVEELPCDLLDHEDPHYLITQAEVRLRHRHEQHQERLERARRAQQP